MSELEENVPESSPPAQLPAVPADGLKQAIDGLSLEINRLLSAPKTLTTFETVKEIAGVGHQVILLQTLLRDLSLEDLSDDVLPEDLAGLFGNRNDCGPNMQYMGGAVGGGLADRVGRRLQRAQGNINPIRRPNGNGARIRPMYGAQVVDPDPYHQPDGYGAPFNAPQTDGPFEDGDQAAYAAARELRGLIQELKDERTELIREHGDGHDELAGLNARITKLKSRMERLMAWITGDVEEKPESAPRPPLHCTACDQTQNPLWRNPDGSPLPCDVCGAPMVDAKAKAPETAEPPPENPTQPKEKTA